MRQNKTLIKAVTFDLWETLLSEKDGFNLERMNARCQNLAQTLNELGISITADQFAFAFKQMTPWLEGIWENDREVTHYDQIQFIINAASEGTVSLRGEWFEQLSTAYVSAMNEVRPILNPDTSRVLQWLKEQDKRMGIICNTGLTPGFGLRRLLNDVGVAGYFDSMLFSDEVGVRKPSPKIFQKAAQKLKTKPCNIIHVGDNLRSDIWGAQNAGFKAILLTSTVGRDRIAESDPTSLVSISRKLGDLREEQIIPSKIVTSLGDTVKAIQELEA